MFLKSKFLQQYNDFEYQMKPYSKKYKKWQTLSPDDRLQIERRVILFLEKNPEFYSFSPKGNIPFIFLCAECGFENAVKWFLDNINYKNIVDINGNNIAMYAYIYKLENILPIVKSDYTLSHTENNQKLSLAYYLEKEESLQKYLTESDNKNKSK